VDGRNGCQRPFDLYFRADDPAGTRFAHLMNQDSHPSRILRSVAVIEAAKGVVVLLVAVGLLSLVHRDAQSVARKLVELSHLDPASRYAHAFVRAASTLNDGRLWLLAGCAGAYAVVRFVEAYGLWGARRWAEWLAALSGAIYVPIEIYELRHGITSVKVTALAINLAIVLYMVRELSRRSNPRHTS
jgi:uncharacterized membrane protein (DUF2068 family)